MLFSFSKNFTNINWFILIHSSPYHVTTCLFIQSTTKRNTWMIIVSNVTTYEMLFISFFIIKFRDRTDIYILYIHQHFKAHAMLKLSFDWIQIRLHDLFRLFIYEEDKEDNYSFAFNVICLLHVNLMNYLQIPKIKRSVNHFHCFIFNESKKI